LKHLVRLAGVAVRSPRAPALSDRAFVSRGVMPTLSRDDGGTVDAARMRPPGRLEVLS
jgi:hypothetical protein